jgi:hypothetical protein
MDWGLVSMPDFEEMRKAVENATSDDIVTRLRDWHIDGVYTIYGEAADEIEQLREERDKLRIVAQKLYLWLVPDFSDDEIAEAGLTAYQEFAKLHKEILGD